MAFSQTLWGAWLLCSLSCLLWGQTESAVTVTSYRCGYSWHVTLDRSDLPYTVACETGTILKFEQSAMAGDCAGQTEYINGDFNRCRGGKTSCVLPEEGSDKPILGPGRCEGVVPDSFSVAYLCQGVNPDGCLEGK